MNIYVGNLSGDVGDDDLKKAFEAYGQVSSATVIRDKFTGESRGYGFVEMPYNDEAQAAIEGLNGTDLMGQSLTVNQARPRSERRGNRGRSDRGGRGGFGGKGGYFGGKDKYGSSGGGKRGNR